MTDSIYREHRARFLEVLARENAAAVIPTGTPPRRNADSRYRFRPSSDFYYLTGFAEENSVLVLLPQAKEEKSILFMRERDVKAEIWNGRRLGIDAAPEALGVDCALPIAELWNELPDLLKGVPQVVYGFGLDAAFDLRMIQAAGKTRLQARNGAVVPQRWVEPAVWLHEQRLHKSPGELEVMRRAAAITQEAHRAAMREAKPGMNEAELDALLGHTFRRRGGTGEAYPNIVAGGGNACILHYVENDQELKDGDLVLIDAGAEYDYYASDVTRTFPVNGRFSPEQRALYELVLGAEKAGIEAAQPGATINDIHETAVRHLVEGLVSLELLDGPVEEAIEQESYQRFYMHRTGHWLGLDVHDCGAYHHDDGGDRVLTEGMVFTVEPGLYVAEDEESVDDRWRGIGIRIEDDVLITADGHEILTAGIPKTVEEVEAACTAEAASAV